jgi:site-specific recombinase XerD
MVVGKGKTMTQPELLRSQECPEALLPSITSAAQFLSELNSYFATVRGLAEGTRRKYGRFVQRFLDGWCGDGPPNWQDLSTEHLRAYMRRELSGKRRRPSNSPIIALRAMLRFLAVRGLTQPGLEETLPRIRRWRHVTLPPRLSCADLDRLIKCAGMLQRFNRCGTRRSCCCS